MRISYYYSGWPTNIGNAFIDYGSVFTIKTAAPHAQVYCASELPKWIFWFNGLDMDKSIDLVELSNVDCLVISGMSMCDEFIDIEGPTLRKLSSRGVKIVFSGCGGATYTEKEVKSFREFLKNLSLGGFISRDTVSYENFKDLFPLSYNGIDCAFFLSDVFNGAPLTIKDFVVYNFDRIEEPSIDQPNNNIIRTHHSCAEVLQPSVVNRKCLFALRSTWPFVERVQVDHSRNRLLEHTNTLISDTPDDYLHLYANVSAVYSDRVHACIAALAFGNSARLYSDSPRTYLFDRVRAGQIREKLVKLDMEMLKQEKQKQLAALRTIFNGGH